MEGIYISISALILSLIAIVVSIYFSRKSLKQAEKLVYAQLTYGDMKKVLESILQICNEEKSLEKMDNKIRDVLYSYKGSLIPKEFRLHLIEQFDKIRKHEEKAPWYQEPPEMSEEYHKSQMEYETSLDPIERYEKKEHDLMNNIKSSIENKISEVLSKLPKR